MRTDLPDFAAPPLIETVFGVEFPPLKAWDIRHYGLLWQDVRDEYPVFQVQSPLRSTIERFGVDVFQQTEPRVELVSVPDLRCWFTNHSGSKLLQVQKDRFIRNWRQADSDPYPRYETLRPAFEVEWRRFCEFLARNSIEIPEVVQCEVTYINHLERGREWSSFDDLPEILSCWSPAPSFTFLPSLETALIRANYLMPDGKGRLSIVLQHALRGSDAKEVLQLMLTARGKPGGTSPAEMLAWFDLGREWVVRGFADITSKRMHDHWERKQ